MFDRGGFERGENTVVNNLRNLLRLDLELR